MITGVIAALVGCVALADESRAPGPDVAAVRARLAARHQSRAVWMHQALNLRPDQEARWRSMLAVLAPDSPAAADRDETIRRFYAGLDPAQQKTFDRMVDWSKPRSDAAP